MKLKSAFFSLINVFFSTTILSCTSLRIEESKTPEDVTIKNASAGEETYRGAYNTFTFRATLMTRKVAEAIISKRNTFYKWDAAKRAEARAKMEEHQATSTDVFISFFTPEPRDNNLDQRNAIWKVYLETGGRRYEPIVKKDTTHFTELQSLITYHVRWNTPYVATFAIPTSQLDLGPSTLTITGPLGSKTVDFKSN